MVELIALVGIYFDGFLIGKMASWDKKMWCLIFNDL